MFVKGYKKDTGYDIISDQDVCVEGFKTIIVRLPVTFNPPVNTLAFLKERTSTAMLGVTVASPPIDSGYTDNLHAILTNTTPYPVTFKKGDRFCQLVVYPPKNGPKNFKVLHPNRNRGKGAFGSSNK